MRRIIIRLLLALLTFLTGFSSDTFISTLRTLLTNSAEIPTVSLPIESPIEPPKPVVSETLLSPYSCSLNYCFNESDVIQPSTSKRMPVVSGGILNGKALDLPKPEYPALAKAAHVSGTVVVRVVVNVRGVVVSACAVSGHPLLRMSAVAAACDARFPPSTITGAPIFVSGVITYNFILD